MTSPGFKTTQDYWDSTHRAEPRLRLPSRLIVTTRNLQRILEARVKRGDRVLEFGFAPGKLLVWVAKVLGARVTGIDYSPPGVDFSRRLFAALGAESDLRCADAFTTSLPAVFDLVYSAGLIEHFDDPREIVRRHVLPLKPGGTALILIPHYGGLYGRLQGRFDPENLAIHNTAIMSCEALRAVAPSDLASAVRAYPFGRIDPTLVSLGRRWPRSLARMVLLAGNAAGLAQPFDVAALCPFLVLEVTRNAKAA